jgi:hypothetical protein
MLPQTPAFVHRQGAQAALAVASRRQDPLCSYGWPRRSLLAALRQARTLAPMKTTIECVVLALCLAASGTALAANKGPAMGKQAYEAAKDRIEAQYQADGKLCNGRKDHAKDVCEAEAKGRAAALKAELEAQYRPSPEASLKAKSVTADANYDVAKTRCEAFDGRRKDRCMKEAKGAREAAVRQAKVEKVQETGGPFASSSAAARKGRKDGSS